MRLPRSRAGSSGRISRAAPFLLAGALAFATVPLSPVRHPAALALAAVLAVAAGGALIAVPRRLPTATWRVMALAFLAIPVLLAVATGGAAPGYAPLLMLPLAWCAMYGSALTLYGVLAGGVGWLLVRLALAPAGTEAGVWRENILLLVTAAAIAPAVQRLVQTLKRRDDELAEQLAGLDASERRMRQIIDMAPEAFVEFDADGIITDWNPRAEIVSGYAREEA
ncbi:MAG TPA: PAS domain S-box protein, partial [Solirubrobacteraceae bacterium]